MEQLVQRLYDQLKRECSDEDEQLTVCNLLLSKVSQATDVSKLHAGGLAEMQACTAIGLKWNRQGIHGADAVNAHGEGVEIKTYKRVQGGNSMSINYAFPARKKGESDEVYRTRVVNYFLTSPKFIGGHYWVAFNQDKTEVYRWNYADTMTVATLVNDYLKRNPTSKSINFGGTLCKQCHRCHKVDAITKLYLPKAASQKRCLLLKE